MTREKERERERKRERQKQTIFICAYVLMMFLKGQVACPVHSIPREEYHFSCH